MGTFADEVGEELLSLLKRSVNSKRARMQVHINEPFLDGPWNNLTVKGVAHLSGKGEDYWSFDFTFRNRTARDFLKTCELEIPKPKEVVSGD